MPTAKATTTRSASKRAKTTAKGAGARRAGSTVRARKASKVKSAKVKRTSVKRPKARSAKAARAKAARTRAVNQTNAAIHQAEIASRETGGVFGEYAERAVLIPVGVALTARDRVLSSVTDTVSTYSSPAKAQAQLRRFERRGATARKRLEREVRKARVRVERELRQRRREIERSVGELEERRYAVAKNGNGLANRVPELATRVQERILTLV